MTLDKVLLINLTLFIDIKEKKKSESLFEKFLSKMSKNNQNVKNCDFRVFALFPVLNDCALLQPLKMEFDSPIFLAFILLIKVMEIFLFFLLWINFNIQVLN